MGSLIEINDTLKISKERGFPLGLCLEDHFAHPENAQHFIGKEFRFWNQGERLYHRPPTRVFLVEEVRIGEEKKWLYWGHAMVIQQTMCADKTEGILQIVKIYDPGYQILATFQESPAGKSYFSKAETVDVTSI